LIKPVAANTLLPLLCSKWSIRNFKVVPLAAGWAVA